MIDGLAASTSEVEAGWERKLLQQGFDRGSTDWQDGVHTDPYIPAEGPIDARISLLSQGWAAGQNYHFAQAAEEYDALIRRHGR